MPILNINNKNIMMQHLLAYLHNGLSRICYLDEVKTLHASLSGLPGQQFLSRLLKKLEVRYEIEGEDWSRIPATGPVVVVANHPFGGLEGIILGSLLLSRRSDVKILANYLLQRFPELHELMIFVDPFGRRESVKANLPPLRQACRWLRNGGMVGVFPAGEVAHLNLGRREVSDPAWHPSVARLIRQSGAAALPVFFNGANSLWFHLLGLIHPSLRTVLLPREFFNKRGKTITLKIGKVIPFEKLASFATGEEMTAYLRLRTFILKGGLKSVQKRGKASAQLPGESAATPLIPPQNPARLVAEIQRLPAEQTLITSGEYAVHYAHAGQVPNLLREIGRLRELTFRRSHEGTGQALDLDTFDRYYLHLFVWNRQEHELVGAYRLGQTDRLLARRGKTGLYTSTLFRFKMPFLAQITPALELGRSFVRPEYQKNYLPLLLLWKGISRFVVQNPRYKFLFGAVSINNEYHTISQQLMAATLKLNNYLPELAKMVKPKNPYPAYKPIKGCDFKALRVIQDVNEVAELISDLEIINRGIPVLLKQYLKLGAKILGFNKDQHFSNVLDALFLVDLTKTPVNLLERYMGKDGVAEFLAYHEPERRRTAAGA